MATFTRCFKGRRAGRDPRLPPGQYDTGTTWPVLTGFWEQNRYHDRADPWLEQRYLGD